MNILRAGGPLAQQLAAVEDQEGTSDDSRKLLLWVTQFFYLQSPQDSHENVFDAPLKLDGEITIDGVVVSEERDVRSVALLKFAPDATRGTANALVRLVEHLGAIGDDSRGLVAQLASTGNRLRQLLAPILASRVGDDVVVTLAIISFAPIAPAARRRVAGATSRVHLDFLDGPYLNALALAAGQPGTLDATLAVPIVPGEYLRTHAGPNELFVVPVSGATIADWPGIDDRRLFDLNVRFALGMNRVRKSLDNALQQNSDQADFIAYHNGLTVVCNQANVTGETLQLRGVSVVNGAQSVIALRANRVHLADELRILVKFVVVPQDDPIAQQIAIRSNTQNPVTTRNLQALEPVQTLLVQQLADLNYVYVTRPDATTPAGPRVIRNDDVAQLLCSLYLERPWLAVKRQVLFEPENYQQIFPPEIDSRRVVLAHLLRQAVEVRRSDFPDAYKRAWSLTSLTAVYVAGQIMRADPEGRDLLLSPGESVRDPESQIAALLPFVDGAVLSMGAHHARRSEEGYDDFKVEFKQQRALSVLGSDAAKHWRRVQRDA